MKKIKKALQDFALKFYVKTSNIKDSTVEALSNTDGDAYIDTVVKILIAVVVGALLLWGLYELMGDVVMEELKAKIESLFDQTKTKA